MGLPKPSPTDPAQHKALLEPLLEIGILNPEQRPPGGQGITLGPTVDDRARHSPLFCFRGKERVLEGCFGIKARPGVHQEAHLVVGQIRRAAVDGLEKSFEVVGVQVPYLSTEPRCPVDPIPVRQGFVKRHLGKARSGRHFGGIPLGIPTPAQRKCSAQGAGDQDRYGNFLQTGSDSSLQAH